MDLQYLEASGSEVLDRLNKVVSWLHQEGFYAAESALLAEVENRYPDQASISTRSPDQASESVDNGAAFEVPQDDTIELKIPAMVRTDSAENSFNSAERCGAQNCN